MSMRLAAALACLGVCGALLSAERIPDGGGRRLSVAGFERGFFGALEPWRRLWMIMSPLVRRVVMRAEGPLPHLERSSWMLTKDAVSCDRTVIGKGCGEEVESVVVVVERIGVRVVSAR